MCCMLSVTPPHHHHLPMSLSCIDFFLETISPTVTSSVPAVVHWQMSFIEQPRPPVLSPQHSAKETAGSLVLVLGKGSPEASSIETRVPGM